MAAAIEFKSVNKYFGQHHVLVDVDLSVDAGEPITGPGVKLATLDSGPAVTQDQTVCTKNGGLR
jgi:ABC-type polar amino acid transport system ATPase subunit